METDNIKILHFFSCILQKTSDSITIVELKLIFCIIILGKFF
jgi:hypothetical protein